MYSDSKYSPTPKELAISAYNLLLISKLVQLYFAIFHITTHPYRLNIFKFSTLHHVLVIEKLKINRSNFEIKLN